MMLKKIRLLKQMLGFVGAVFLIFVISHLMHPIIGMILVKLELIEKKPHWLYPLITLAMFSVVIGVTTSIFVNANIVRPIKLLIMSINRVAAGNFKSKVEATSRLKYFQKMITSFNKMLDELNGNEMLKSDFINNFSHEFKTPINAIQGFAKQLQNSNLSEQQKQEYIDIMIYETQRLSSLATNVLNLSKVEHQVILSNKTQFNLSEQLREVVIMLYDKCTAKNVEVEFDSAEVEIIGDRELLKQVWINLLDNAIKFCYKNSVIKIKIATTVAKVNVSIANDGEPLSANAQKRIFDKFYQADASHATAGNGLGLTIAKKIIQLHGGNIYVVGESKITMEVFLPIKN